MKTILRITVLSLLSFALGCSKEDNEVPVVVKSDAKAITSFSFAATENAALNENISATITETSKTVSGSVPSGTDVTALTPTVQVSVKANVSPSGPQDFSSPITYTVTAEDGSAAKYTASITILELENRAPLDFELIAVTDNAVEVDVLPTFSWNAATDPDGDTVTYDLYLNEGDTADQLYAENLSNTTLEVTERLGLLQDYTWRVIAKDSKGAMVSSNSRSFSTRNIEFGFADLPNVGNRDDHTSIVFENKIWAIGGFGSDYRPQNDVRFSTDGLIWEEATNSATFAKRSGHTSIVFDNKIWVIGGRTLLEDLNDVWFSADGVTWLEATESAPFQKRHNHTSIVFDNKIWVIGGVNQNDGFKNDVWFSSDGITWAQADVTMPFAPRDKHTSVVFDNKIWVIAGRSVSDGFLDIKNDIWYSEDGTVWMEATNDASFAAREDHTSVVFDNKIWVIGGRDDSFRASNDVWYSSDGINWIEATKAAPFEERPSHTSVVFDNKIWVIAGYDVNLDMNRGDVWFFD